jgi:hypothetical protein
MDDSSKAYFLVLAFFKSDHDKTDLWFITPNPMFGNLKPCEVPGRKLLHVVEDLLESNLP